MKRSWFAPWRRPDAYPEPVCREAVELVTSYLDEVLEQGPRAALERHLAKCPHCTEYFAQIRRVRDLAGKVEPEELTPQARDGLAALYLDWLGDPESGPES